MRKLLDRQTELDLARSWKDDRDEQALARLVEAFQPLIIKIARKAMRGKIEIEDLIQEGTLGFMAGLENFNPDLGYGVGTLTRFHIHSYIQMHVMEFSGAIRLPKSRRIKNLISKVIAEERKLETVRGEAISQDDRIEICKAHGFKLDTNDSMLTQFLSLFATETMA